MYTSNLINPPVRTAATPTITPFTYYDGATYLEILEALRRWLTDVLVPDINGVYGYVDERITETVNYVDTAIAENKSWTEQEINALTAYVDGAVQQVINESIEVQDPVVAGLVTDEQSATRDVLDERYSRIPLNVKDYGAVADGVTDD